MENDIQLGRWLEGLSKEKPLVIAGPCSAETEEQVLKVARGVAQCGVPIFRAGIWKPRTRPGGFEGVGAIGLKWLQKAKAETRLLMAVEVASAAHVRLALDHGVDVLWIGARTTVNPFLVQEIADAVEGSDKIILVKNPVNPDLALWLGGIERIYNAGIRKIGAIHRGFSTYEKTRYRNNPEWQIALELQDRLPDLPLICDPSHITGKRSMIGEVSQQALDLNYRGLMIETHIDPDNAWSDAAQQVTPEMLGEILKALVVRNPDDDSDDFVRELSKLRSRVDEFDSRIIEALGNRMRIADKIGALKKERNVAVIQPQRWREVLNRMSSEGARLNLSEDFIQKLFHAIHQESIAHQQAVIRKNQEKP